VSQNYRKRLLVSSFITVCRSVCLSVCPLGVKLDKLHPYTSTAVLYRPYGPQGSRDIAVLFLDHSTRRGWGVSFTPRPLFTPGKEPVPIVQKAGWATGPVWTVAENLTPTGIRSPDRPARSQSLYRLSYPAHCPLGDGPNIFLVWHCLFYKISRT